MISEFLGQLNVKPFDGIEKIQKKHFLVSETLEKIRDKIGLKPVSIGSYLGEEKKGAFQPSIGMLDIASEKSDKKLYVERRAEWLFLCGRDLMAGSIIKSNAQKGIVLVQNSRDENLGIGKIIGDIGKKGSSIVVKNILDRGDFLRREMD